MELLGYNLADNGGRNYWGYFPERLSAAGYQPFEFIWHTNARFKDVAADLASAISDINLQTGRKVHIVAHSFGGILTRRLLQDPDVNGVAALIASVTTIGTPHLGIFDSETTYGGITFPGGQDSVLFEGHSQISAHLMGENAFGSHIASLLGFSGSPGEEAYFLASNISLLPPLNFLNLPGFTQFLNQYRFVGPGDNLLTAETQRFLTDFVFSGGNPAWQLFADSGNYPIGAATVTEYALGRRIGSDHDMELRPGQQVSISDFVEYKHSKATPGGTLGGALASEPYVPESGYHDGYQRVIEWLTANGSPAISALPLNDTGIDWGGNYPSGNNATCTGETIAAQDCSHGRDATHNDDADGHAGFSFTKLDSNGNALSASASTWSCVRDEVTGLTWEAKTNDGGLQDTDNTYTWYNPDSSTNGGNSGTQNGGSCSGSDCDTYGYVQAVNAEAQALCGARDWRMPWREELRSIVDYGRTIPAIDTVFFPNQRSSGVWSGSPGASGYAWGVGFGYGGDYGDNRSSNSQVRLVRGGQ